MNRVSTIFLQTVIVFIGISALAFMLWEPHLEGRNVQATPFEIYFNDPFLAYAYMASTSFFVVLYQSFKVLGYVRENEVFSLATMKALRIIRYGAIALIVSVAGAEAYLLVVQHSKDDIAGGVAMGLVVMFVSLIVATVAAMFEQILRNAVDMKSNPLLK